MAIKDVIKQRRLELGLTLEQVANEVHTSKQTIHRYESGVISNIPSDKIEALAKALKTTPEHIMGWDAISNDTQITMDEDALLSLYRQLNDDGKGRVRNYTEDLVASERYKEK